MQTEAELAELASPAVALSGAVLLGVSAAIAPGVVALVRRIWPGRNVFFARWGFGHVIQALLVFLLAQVAIALVAPIEEIEDSILWLLGLSSLSFGCVVAFVLATARRLDPIGIASLGLRKGGNLRALFAGVAAYLLLLPAFFGAGLVWPWVLTLLGEPVEPQVFGELFGNAGTVELVGGIVLAVLVMPFFEELLYRGFLQPLLVQNFRDRGGLVLTSVLFALPHGASAFLPIFVLSLVLGGIMLRTQRLLAVWGLHALHNGLQLAILLGGGAIT